MSTFFAHSSRQQRLFTIGAAAWLLFLIALPLAHMNALRNIALIITLSAAALIYLSNPKSQRWPLWWMFAIWLIAALCSLISSTDRALALNLIWNEIGKSLLVFYAGYVLVATKPESRSWGFGALTSLALLSALGIISWYQNGSWQPTGLAPALGDYTTSTMTLLPLACLPCFPALRSHLGGIALPLTIAAFGLALIAGVLTMSRGFWLILIVISACAALPLIWRASKNRHSLLLILAIAILAALVLALVVAHWRGRNLLDFSDRTVIYLPVLQHVLDAPWHGYGYGHEAQAQWYVANMRDQQILHAHNITLSYVEQMGLPGILTLLAIFGGLAQRFIRHLQTDDARRAALAALGFALVTGLFVRNSLDIFFVRHNQLLFFAVGGTLLGMLEGRQPQ